MKNWDEDDGTEYCTAVTDLEDAQKVCDILKITLHTANFAAEYWDNVFDNFLAEYRKGRTPNPDILCNREIKFEQFVRYANALGADYIATGHYVRRDPEPQTDDAPENIKAALPQILKGLDQSKDQTYFLQAVPAEKLAGCLFPLGGWQKSDIRRVAENLGLPNHRKKDSTGICFIGERRFDDFLAEYIEDKPGSISDPQGRLLGQHRGLHQYTRGQRQRIKLGGFSGRPEKPWYVMGKTTEPTPSPSRKMWRICRGYGLEQAVSIGFSPHSCPCDATQRYATAKMTKVASLAKPQTADSGAF